MTPEELGRLLDELGQRIGPAGEHVFQLAVRQAVIDGVIGIIFGLTLVIGTGVIFVKAVKWILSRESTSSYNDDALDKGFPIGIMSLPAGLLIATGFVSLSSGISSLLNPEYAAIRDILSRIIPQ